MTIKLPMCCNCKEAGKQAMKELMAEVKSRLGEETEELPGREIRDDNFLTNIVMSLNWDFDARITGIANDQWSGVSAECYSTKTTVYVECDRVEHGIAAIWKFFADAKARERQDGVDASPQESPESE